MKFGVQTVVNIKNMISAVRPCCVVVQCEQLRRSCCLCLQVQNEGSIIPSNVGAFLLNCMPAVKDHTLVCMNLHLSSDLEQ